MTHASRPGRRVVRRVVGTVVVLHGLLHLLGAAKGLGWADVTALSQPIGSATGGAWLLAAVLVVVAGVLLLRSARWWWVVSAVAALVSQVLIATSWTDARAGSAVNVVLLVAAAYGWASQGRVSLTSEYRRRVSALRCDTPPSAPADVTGQCVTDADLTALPALVAAYLRRAGTVGQPRVTGFRARIHGRIRSGATSSWMSFTGEQVNTYGPDSCRLFRMDASLHGVPVDVLHVFTGDRATMRVRAASVLQLVDAAGPEMNRAETVTLLNDMCVLAPAALLDADVSWTVLGPARVQAAFTRGPQQVAAELVFDGDGDLVDFVSDDRLAGSSDGRTFSPRRWSTPLTRYRSLGGRRLATHGDACWGGPDPDEHFTYLELTVDEIEYDARSRNLVQGARCSAWPDVRGQGARGRSPLLRAGDDRQSGRMDTQGVDDV